MKEFITKNRNKLAIIATPVAVALASMPVYAEDSATVTAVNAAMSSIQTDAMAVFSSVAPIAVAIAGALIVWRLGLRFFKSLAK